MTCQIVALRPKDRLRQDGAPIALLYRNMGTAAAEQLVTRALGELAMTLAGIDARMRAHDLADLPRPLHRVERMAEQLGMTSLGEVAADLRACLAAGDGTAVAAVWARMGRIAERSLAAERTGLDHQA